MAREVKPWRRLRRGLEHDFSVARVREDWWADPRTGHEHPRVRVDCADWVNVIAVTPDAQLVLVRQFRFGVEASTLELPGGIVEPGEAPERAAARELEEETGYVPGRMVPVGQVHPNPAFQGNVCFNFLALDCVKRHEGRQDAGEDIAVELHPRADLPRLILEGHISHSLVVAAFFQERLLSESK
ncbi:MULTISPECIES: NUDIX hydrolase [Myxococcus]|uniref:GDP-mannose pyrophosphatase n=1 Tax=Myxococcus xanthus TaxID=34 RepID=A0AAE6KRD9_MYXXA|nr:MULTISPECIES: NUDIX hydrolase [Myxococcus]QDE67177.1 NUDIX hydrolase [Myxococcus xanthus]QDE74452.1 NUDIX hydrolase [Myxococcus xanthus]QDE96038.1 NUDIX hydrolase [Myxococcus xanthus]QDF03483.1 NUDIX hydrolase [Myxococcus xanthus]WAM28383.1 NUDIX hydrolase [Myxococcus sp. NMCA1]